MSGTTFQLHDATGQRKYLTRDERDAFLEAVVGRYPVTVTPESKTLTRQFRRLMEEPMCWLVEFHEVVRTYGLVSGGVLALAIAAWRSWVSARNLGLERYKAGAELLDGKIHGHTARISGARILGEYGKFSCKKHRRVMAVFEAFLTHPPRFAGDHGSHQGGTPHRL